MRIISGMLLPTPIRHAGARRLLPVSALVVALATTMPACAPALDWREVQVWPGEGLKATFPCKPDRHQRQIAWAGLPDGATMHLLTCQADGVTWAVNAMTLPEVALVGPALDHLRASMQANLAAAANMAVAAQPVSSQDLGPVTVPRMTPMPQAHAWAFSAQRPDGLGRPMAQQVRAWHFAHGLTVFQASVWRSGEASSRQSSEDMANEFFRSFQFPG